MSFSRSDCQFSPGDTDEYLFASPTEICHWNSTVWDSIPPPESPEDISEVSSQSEESSRDFSGPSSPYTMDHSHSLYHSNPNSIGQWSPGALAKDLPEDYPTGAWLDSQRTGPGPFSPVHSDFAIPSSASSLVSIAPATSQDLPHIDHFASTNWSSQLTDHSYIDESAVSERSYFPIHNNSQPEVMPVGYQSWFTPSEVNFEQYFKMDQLDQPQGPVAGYSNVAPQTAGFVGCTPALPSCVSGPSYRVTGPIGDHHESASSGILAGPSGNLAGTSGSLTGASGNLAGPSGNLSDGPYQGQMGAFLPAVQSSDINDSLQAHLFQPQPQRHSISAHPPLPWSSGEVDFRTSHGYESGLNALLVPSSYPTTHISGVSSAPGSVANVQIERSMSTVSGLSTKARSEDGEGKPRSHKYYTTARPQADGTYHCPYVATEKCPHKPTKLKCNYDKYIDSHLKPFVCKQNGCKGTDNENRFSSTACLLRHEREAHGLHGHGNKPYLCKYEGCDRSMPGNGFPRNYNLMDHMKRVHRFHPEDNLAVAGTSSGSNKRGNNQKTNAYSNRVQKTKRPEGPKRTLTGISVSSRRHAAAAAAAAAATVPVVSAAPAPSLPASSTLIAHEWAEFNACKDLLQQRLRRMQDQDYSHNPLEATLQLQQLNEEMARKFH